MDIQPMWISYLFAVLPVPVDLSCPPAPPIEVAVLSQIHPEGSRNRAVTTNFQVTAAAHDARNVAALCERRRSELEQAWSAGGDFPTWTPRCEIVVHSTLASYRAAVGCGSESTKGSSWIRVEAGKITCRRIDLLAEGRELPALTHELTHVVLADLFGGRRLPPWADEGLATLSDSVVKRRLHQRDLKRALCQQTAWPLATLMTRERLPVSAHFPTFYAQSASLTDYLIRQKGPGQFVHFIKEAMDHGYDQALANEYSIEGIGQLERLWKANAAQIAASNGEVREAR